MSSKRGTGFGEKYIFSPSRLILRSVWCNMQKPPVTVGVAQLVRAPDCGSGGRRFDSVHPPHCAGRFVRRFSYGMSPSGKAQDFDSCSRGFESRHPSQKGRLQGVPFGWDGKKGFETSSVGAREKRAAAAGATCRGHVASARRESRRFPAKTGLQFFHTGNPVICLESIDHTWF